MVTMLLPWEIWVARETGRLVLVTDAVINSLRDGISFNHKSFREPLPFNDRLNELQQRISSEYATFEDAPALLAFLRREARRDPLAVLQLYGLKTIRSWYGLDSQDRSRERWLRWLSMLFVGLAVELFWPVNGESRALRTSLRGGKTSSNGNSWSPDRSGSHLASTPTP